MRPYPKRQEWEHRYVSEYISRHYPQAQFFLHLRLGSAPQPKPEESLIEGEERLLRVYMRWADAVVITSTDVVVVEGKLRPAEYARGIAQLELYKIIAPSTPELKPFLPRTIKTRLVVALDDPAAAQLCREKGIEYHVWRPAWYDEYVMRLRGRDTRLPRGGPLR